MDLIHEDLNAITKKPYIELSDNTDRPDTEIAKEFWDAFLARNQSIVTDLMYGQLKSTVTCLTCGYISLAFDPYLMLSIPIMKQLTFNVSYLPFQRITNGEPTNIRNISVHPKTSWTVLELK